MTTLLGRDTTAQSMTWAFYMLMRYPSVQRKIIAEVNATIRVTDGQLDLSFENVQPNSLPYTMAVFNETLRLHPPVPVELKECTTSTTFPDGTCLPSGSIVLWVPWAINRSKLTWGEDADEFRPERWLTANSAGQSFTPVTRSPSEFPVFNGGARSCLGKKMAELLAVHVIATLACKYEFKEIYYEEPRAGESPRPRLSQNSLTLPMRGGLPCTLSKRT